MGRDRELAGFDTYTARVGATYQFPHVAWAPWVSRSQLNIQRRALSRRLQRLPQRAARPRVRRRQRAAVQSERERVHRSRSPPGTERRLGHAHTRNTARRASVKLRVQGSRSSRPLSVSGDSHQGDPSMRFSTSALGLLAGFLRSSSPPPYRPRPARKAGCSLPARSSRNCATRPTSRSRIACSTAPTASPSSPISPRSPSSPVGAGAAGCWSCATARASSATRCSSA